MYILGIWDGHDSGAALFVDGKLKSAVNEERLSRRKLEICFPRRSIEACLEITGVAAEDVGIVASSTTDVAKTLGRWIPSTKESYYQIRRRKVQPGFAADLKKRLKYWVTEWPPNRLSRRLSLAAVKSELNAVGLGHAEVRLYDHHRCHAAGAVLAAGHDPCLALTIDGVGDGLSATVSVFEDGELKLIAASPARSSLGIFFEHVTNLMNMRELEDEGKVMALADHTFPIPDDENPCLDLVWVEGLQLKTAVPARTLYRKLKKIQWHYPSEQFAYLAQRTVERRMADFVRAAVKETGIGNLALAGGVASNVKANRQIRLLPEVKDVFVFPHMGDGGLAVGAGALAAQRVGDDPLLELVDLSLGPDYSDAFFRDVLEHMSLKFRQPSDLAAEVADLIANDAVVLWFQGRMEYGPRALGQRSVLARPDKSEIRDRLNLVLKRRAWFQPFCPSMLESAAKEVLADYTGRPNRHMTMIYRVRDNKKGRLAGVISIDGMCRPQMVADDDPSLFGAVLRAVAQKLGIGILLNTSFNIHGEPLVCSPEEARDVFERCGADALVLGPYLMERRI